MAQRPGGELATRPLHFIWIADCSGSMSSDAKMQWLNRAIREAIPHMQKVGDENPNAKVLVRAVSFGSAAKWHIAQETPVGDFKWTDLAAGGDTPMGKALTLVAEQLHIPPMTDRALPPVLVLISDGQPTDDFVGGLKALIAEPWGRKSIRMAIAIGKDANHDVLQEFIGNPELSVLDSNNPEALVRHIKFVSTAVLKAASSPASQPRGGAGVAQNVPIPTPPTHGSPTADVW